MQVQWLSLHDCLASKCICMYMAGPYAGYGPASVLTYLFMYWQKAVLISVQRQFIQVKIKSKMFRCRLKSPKSSRANFLTTIVCCSSGTHGHPKGKGISLDKVKVLKLRMNKEFTEYIMHKADLCFNHLYVCMMPPVEGSTLDISWVWDGEWSNMNVPPRCVEI